MEFKKEKESWVRRYILAILLVVFLILFTIYSLVVNDRLLQPMTYMVLLFGIGAQCINK